MSNPLLSVLIPVYNGAQFIHECLDSVFNQTYSNLEILISDDGSTDDSKELLDQLKDPRIKIFYHKRQQGWVANCNFLISKVKGSYFSILPQDDLIPPKYLETLFKKFNKNDNRVNCFPYVQSIGINSGEIRQASITGTLEDRIYDVILNHFWGVSFRGLVKNNITDAFRFLNRDQHHDMMADTIWILQHAIAGELYEVRIPYQKRYHTKNEHSTWTRQPIDIKIKAWSQHCATLYNLARPYISDEKVLYKNSLIRLLEKKKYLLKILNNDYDHLLLREFNEKINYD